MDGLTDNDAARSQKSQLLAHAVKVPLQHSPHHVPLLLLDAEVSFQRVPKNDPAHFEARLGLARAALLQGKILQAAVRAIPITADTPTWRRGLGVMYR